MFNYKDHIKYLNIRMGKKTIIFKILGLAMLLTNSLATVGLKCTVGNPTSCATGQSCILDGKNTAFTNGICRKTCSGIKDCSNGEYCLNNAGCEGACVPRTSDTGIPCVPGQIWTNGKCLCNGVDCQNSIIKDQKCIRGRCRCDPRLSIAGEDYYAINFQFDDPNPVNLDPANPTFFGDQCTLASGRSCAADPTVCAAGSASGFFSDLCAQADLATSDCNPKCLLTDQGTKECVLPFIP